MAIIQYKLPLAVIKGLVPEIQKKTLPVRLSSTTPGSESFTFKDWVKRIAAEEARKQLDKLSTVLQQGQQDAVFLAEMNDDLTIATDPNGNEYSAITIGDITSKYVPFFKLTGDRGIAYSPEVSLLSIDATTKPAYVAVLVDNAIYVRNLGSSLLAAVQSIPSNIDTANVQALFSANAKHFMVGWWWKDTEAPYYSHATYTIYTNFSITITNEEAVFGYDSSESRTFDLNPLANGLAIPPDFNTPEAVYIWFNHPSVDGPGGDYARFFPVVTSYYNTVTNPYEYTYHPEWPDNFVRQSNTQDGNYTATWYLDPATLADFRSVKFAFNNKEDGTPTVDIVCAYRAICAGMMLNQEGLDDQGMNYFRSITYSDGSFFGTQTVDAHFQQHFKSTWTYNYDYNFIGELFTWTANDLSDPYDLWAQTLEDYSQTSPDPSGNYSTSGATKIYPYVPANPPAVFPFFEEIFGDGVTAANNLAYVTFVGSVDGPPIFLNPPDETTYLLTTYDGVEKTAAYVSNPNGYVSFPEVFAYPRPGSFTAGWYTNEYFHYTTTIQGPFARDYYFARINMVIEDANNAPLVRFNNGEPPLTENDLSTIITPYRGVNRSTALVYQQATYPVDVVQLDPENDVSYQAIIEILRESGFDALADYLEANPSGGSLDLVTKSIYWFAGSYYNYPLYGYETDYDVITDAVVAPQGTFPFPGQYFKGVDSYAIVGYNGNDDGYESVTLYQVEESGLTSVASRARKLKPTITGTLLDVAIRYGEP